MQVCFQNLPSDRDPAWQPRGTRSSLAVKVCHGGCPRATETKSNVPMRARGMAWTHTNSEQTTASHTSTYRLFLIICEPVAGRTAGPSMAHSWDAQQVPVCLLHFGLCFCRTQLPQAGRPGFPMQEKKERLLPSLQFTLQLEGCLQNSILPQPLPVTTRVKRIYITKLPPSFIFILFITYSNFTYVLQPRNYPRHYACLSLCVQHCAQILSFHMNSS